LNVDIQIVGAITENMPVDPSERARWMNHLWLQDPVYDPSAFPPVARPAFSPNIRYRYDGDLRRMVRVRNLRTGEEKVAWASPLPARQASQVPDVQTVINGWLADPTAPSYSVTLPLIPKLPASATFYEGNPL
jgi:hypothetical protein